MVRKYISGLSVQRKAQLLLKSQTSSMFKGKKENYPFSVSRIFLDTRIALEDINTRVLQMIRHEHIKVNTDKSICASCLFIFLLIRSDLCSPQYSVPVVKYDRNGFRPRLRQLIFTQEAAYLAEEAKIKQRIDYSSLKGVSVSNLSDNFLILHVTCDDSKQKGDLVLQCEHLFEALTKLSVIADKQKCIKVVQGSVRFDIQPGREGFIDFKSGQEFMVYRAKNGHLMVVSLQFKRVKFILKGQTTP
uniref:TH1 domain-containing protein n=1 Tax=Oryzias melastigma TaxID=30732 RepID=A0A3B3CY73_ORYME